MIINGNSLDELKKFPDNHFDSIVTDPPYGLLFMGKKWDYDVPSQELWEECLRVLKPGGYLLAFAGTRTQHRMAVRIEDAGFEIRDMIAWVYGSGFPKSLNIGKAVDKLQGNERITIPNISADGRNRGAEPSKGRVHNPSGMVTHLERTEFTTKGNSPWEGWGTALKPALEPITVARKPISEKNIAENVLKWRTGGINIDGCRVEYENGGTKATNPTLRNDNGENSKDYGKSSMFARDRAIIVHNNIGRFPANLIHDGSDEVTTLVGEPARFFYCAKASKSERNKGLEGFEVRTVNDGRDTPIDNAFQRGETPRANIHPTVKPVALMRYLVKLVTPPNGLVLDPFNGSGTTGIAAKLENFDYIGIELDPEYCKISEARIVGWEVEPQEKLL